MTIATLDNLIAGMKPPTQFFKVGATMEAAGILTSLLYAAGLPGAAAVPSPGLAGAALTNYPGQIPVPAPVGGQNIHLARLDGAGTLAGRLLLVDRLWHNSGLDVTATGAQTVNSASWPARDRNGATDGVDVMVGIEVSTATTNASAITNCTMSYTDEAGNAGSTATIASFPATAVAGSFIPFALAAGDLGVRSIQSVTLGTSMVAGAIHLVAYRLLAALSNPAVNVGQALDAIALGLPRVYDNSVPQLLWLPTAVTAITTMGQVTFAQA